MPNYNVSVKSSNYQVLSEPQKKYNVGVNYEIPSKYLQYGNEILNVTTWVFNGTNTGFPLIDNAGDAYTPANDQQLIVDHLLEYMRHQHYQLTEIQYWFH